MDDARLQKNFPDDLQGEGEAEQTRLSPAVVQRDDAQKAQGAEAVAQKRDDQLRRLAQEGQYDAEEQNEN